MTGFRVKPGMTNKAKGIPGHYTRVGGMIPPKHIVWSMGNREIDLSDPSDRAWWIKQVLMHGRIEDVLALDFDEVERLLPGLYLPRPVRKLWSDYFAAKGSTQPIPEEGP
jgi:hypothetical protein